MMENPTTKLEHEQRELRDKFAMAAVTGFVSSMGKDCNYFELADMAYNLADAMMTRRES